jgi:DNA-binding CsgD family transcriptional regulator
VLCVAAAIEAEADIAWELCLSVHAVTDRLARLEAKLGVATAADAVTQALREST